MQKKGFRAKSLVVSLLCLCLVCLSGVLPGVLVSANDEKLYDRFIPTGGAKTTAGFSEETMGQLETLGRFKAGELLVDAAAGDDHVRDEGRIEAYCDLLLRQFALLREAGLLSADETEILFALLKPDSPDIIFVIASGDNDGQFIGVNVMYNYGYVCELCLDTTADRAVALSLSLPKDELGLSHTPTDTETGLVSYIGWLGVSGLEDWVITQQPDGSVAAYSPAADLLLSHRRDLSPEGYYRVEYSVS